MFQTGLMMMVMVMTMTVKHVSAAPPSVLICLKQLETCSNMWFQTDVMYAGIDFYDDLFPTI